MTCKKQQQFPTREAAAEHMRKLPQRRSGITPLRVYWCKEHQAYEYTSKPKWKGRF